MTPQERELLLTVARVLRAKVSKEIYAEKEDDLWALHDALKPFEADGGASLNEVYPAAAPR